MSLLSDLYKTATGGIPIGKTGLNFNPLLNPRGFSFQGSKPQATGGDPVVNPSTTSTGTTETSASSTTTKTSDQPTGSVFSKTKTSAGIPSEYINPETGTFYRAEDFAKKVAGSVPRKGTYGGDIPTYAGNTLTQGPKTAEQLAMEAAALNNARNDIATGATDPYKVASQSGIAYSPDELRAIENAYAGIYDPAINSALEKLNKKQEEDLIKFRTDEDIRQYRATTGAERATERAEGRYTIKSGDDLRKIAQEKGVTYEAMVAANPQVDEYNLKPGQVIDLPTGGDIKTKAATREEEEIMAEEDYIAWLNNYKETSGKEPTESEKASVMRAFGLRPSDYNIMDIE